MICAAGYAAERGGPEMGRFFHSRSATPQDCVSDVALQRVDLIVEMTAGCAMLWLFALRSYVDARRSRWISS